MDQLVWQDDRLLINDLVFSLVDGQDDEQALTKDSFALLKGRSQVEAFLTLFAQLGIRPTRIFDIGIWDGGSTALWTELCRPEKVVAVDISDRGDSAYFRRFVDGRGLGEVVRTYWSTDQGDADRLREIVQHEFAGPLDLVIDDGAHLHGPTERAFEALFPFLAPGGLYVIEDWNWAHAAEIHDPAHPWASLEDPGRFIVKLVEATGTVHTGLIASLRVVANLVIVTRGWLPLPDPQAFRLDDYILRRPPPPTEPKKTKAKKTKGKHTKQPLLLDSTDGNPPD